MPRIAVLPDAENLRAGIQTPALYIEAVSTDDLEDEHVSVQLFDRVEWAVRGLLSGEVGR